jgi:YVTN family beta-propeller protein
VRTLRWTSAALAGAIAVTMLTLVASGAPAALSTGSSGHYSPAGSPTRADLPARSSEVLAQRDPSAITVFQYGVRATLTAASDPVATAYDSATGNLYISNSRSNNVTVVSTTTDKFVASVEVGFNPTGIVYDSTNSMVYVANWLQNYLSEINTTTQHEEAKIPVGHGPTGLAFDSVTNSIYVTNQHSNNVTVISASSRLSIANITVGTQPIAATYDPANQQVYIANADSNTVSVINATTNAVTATIPVGNAPMGIAVDNATGNVYVVNLNSSSMSVIDGASNTVFATVGDVGASPTGVAYDSATSALLITDDTSNETTVIAADSSSVVQQVTVGTYPVGIEYVPSDGFAYVANAGSDNVSVVGSSGLPPYAVNFTESGLPGGTNWSVDLAGTTTSSTTSQISFSEADGTYGFRVTPIADYSISPAAGNVTVRGYPVNVAVSFAQALYAIQFTETGLPNGTYWSVSLGAETANASVAVLQFNAPNGSYDFSIANVKGYYANPPSGSVMLSGTGSSISVHFSTSKPGGDLPLWIWLLIVAVIIAAVATIVLLARRKSTQGPGSSTGGS